MQRNLGSTASTVANGVARFFGTAPQAGTLLVVTHRGLVRLAPDFTATMLLDAHWRQLYPNAAAVDAAGIVYVGMRGVVARLTPQAGGYREEWLFPPTGK